MYAYFELFPIKSLKGVVAALYAAITVLGVWIAQGKIYKSMTGIDVPAQDNYFFAVIIWRRIGIFSVLVMTPSRAVVIPSKARNLLLPEVRNAAPFKPAFGFKRACSSASSAPSAVILSHQQLTTGNWQPGTERYLRSASCVLLPPSLCPTALVRSATPSSS